MREVGFGILRVKRTAVYAAARRTAHNHRYRRAPAKMRLGEQVGDLVEGAADEVHELEFSDRPHAGDGRSEAGIDDRHLGDGSVDHALGAEAVDQAVGNFERAPVDADVLANAEDGRIALHLLPDALPDCLKISNCRHE